MHSDINYAFQYSIKCSLIYFIYLRVVSSSPDEVDFFNLPKPSSRTMAMESTQPLTEMSTRNLPGA
jgi:hypothetical protein